MKFLGIVVEFLIVIAVLFGAALILNPMLGCRRPEPIDPDPPPEGTIEQLHYHHNRVRGVNEKLTMDNMLIAAAQKHAEWMARNRRMSHTGAGGSNFWDRIVDEGYSGISGGENIAYGYRSPKAVFDGWMNSRGHRKNILNSSWVHVGYGVALAEEEPYWCTVFAVPSTATRGDMPERLVLPPPLFKNERP